MSTRFRLLTESDVRAVLTLDDLVDTMASALWQLSTGRVAQPLRTVIPVGPDARLFATMPAYAQETPALGAKLVTVFETNRARRLPTHQATIVLLDPETGTLVALLDGRLVTELRTAAVSAVSSRLLARKDAGSLAILGTGVQARSHLEALARVHALRRVSVWSPSAESRARFAAWAGAAHAVQVVGTPHEAVVGADLIVLATASSLPVLEAAWVEAGAHVMSVGACRPTQREIDPALTARARLFVDSRAAALAESGDVVMGIAEGWFAADHITAEIGEVVNGTPGRRSDREVTIFKSVGLAVEDVAAAALAYRRAIERGIGQDLDL